MTFPLIPRDLLEIITSIARGIALKKITFPTCFSICLQDQGAATALTLADVPLRETVVPFHVKEAELAVSCSLEKGILLDCEVLVQLHVGTDR